MDMETFFAAGYVLTGLFGRELNEWLEAGNVPPETRPLELWERGTTR